MPRLTPLSLTSAALHLVAALALLAGAATLETELPVRLSAPGVPPVPFAAVDLAVATSVVLLVSAVVRLAVSIRPLCDRHVAGLASGRAGWRWLELSQTASITVVLVALLNGVAESGVLVALYALAAGAVVLLWLQDRQTTPGLAGLGAFSAGAAIGIVPWGVIAIYQVTRLVLGEPVGDVVGIGTIALLALSAAQWFSVWWHRERSRAALHAPAAERVFIELTLAHSLVLVLVAVLAG
ncbi:hypothetical protein GCM10009792_16360 [Microcella alkalica]